MQSLEEMTQLVPPHGGALFNLVAPPERLAELRLLSKSLPSWDLTPRQLCDLELLLNGGFSPLSGFLCRADYETVCSDMRLSTGVLWPIPVALDVTEEAARALSVGQLLALRDPEGVMLAVLHVQDIWKPDRISEAEAVYGTTDPRHPGVAYLLSSSHSVYVGGRVEGLQLPIHYDFRSLRHTPAELRELFARLGWQRVVAFQTRNPMHRAHVELTLRAAKQIDASLLIHPSVGMTKPGDVDHYTRVRCYQEILPHYPQNTVHLALLPLAMRMAGPREAIWHAIIRKNYGCTHFVIGRDHAGPGSGTDGKPFYGPYQAQKLLLERAAELGMGVVSFETMVYVKKFDSYFPETEIPKGTRALTISGTELRRMLETGEDIPEWFTFPSVAKQLRQTYPPRYRQGFTLFLTGLSGAGKSTIANVLLVKLLERGGRPVTLLDGDIVRKNLSSELGFSREHRDLNIRRIGFVAKEITKNGGIAICAPIAPYDAVRKEVRNLIASYGGFVLVHIATPLEICEQRDRKGLYAKARAGFLPCFTGISDPYEIPHDAEVVIDTADRAPEESAQAIISYLEREGFVRRVGVKQALQKWSFVRPNGIARPRALG
jgi:sulfate adenylyltransferase